MQPGRVIDTKAWWQPGRGINRMVGRGERRHVLYYSRATCPQTLTFKHACRSCWQYSEEAVHGMCSRTYLVWPQECRRGDNRGFIVFTRQTYYSDDYSKGLSSMQRYLLYLGARQTRQWAWQLGTARVGACMAGNYRGRFFIKFHVWSIVFSWNVICGITRY